MQLSQINKKLYTLSHLNANQIDNELSRHIQGKERCDMKDHNHYHLILQIWQKIIIITIKYKFDKLFFFLIDTHQSVTQVLILISVLNQHSSS